MPLPLVASSCFSKFLTAMLILLNAAIKNRLFKSIKITGCLGIALGIQACTGVYPTKIQNADAAPPRILTATEWSNMQERSEVKTSTTIRRIPITAINASPSVPQVPSTALTAPVNDAANRAEVSQPHPLQDPVIESNQCWAQMVKNPLTQEHISLVVIREGAITYDISPAVVQQKQQTVTVKDGAQTFKVIPPRFKAVQEQIKVSDEIRRITIVPAVYEEKKEDVLVESARNILQTCRSPGQRAVTPDAKSLQKTQCIREIPARYQTITKKVLVTPESTREEITPAQYKTVLRWVLEENGRAQAHEIAAQQIALPYRSVEQGPQIMPKTLEAKVRDIPVKVHTGSPQLVWRRVLCESDLSQPLIEKLQIALISAGESLGKPDGKLGRKTWQAIQSYQNKRRIATGMLSFETLNELGVSQANNN